MADMFALIDRNNKFKLDFSKESAGLPGGVTFARSTMATRTNSSGVIANTAVDEARFDYDPASKINLGVLIEPSVTNQLFPSIPTTTKWKTWITYVTATANAATAPDGTLTATLLDNGTSSGAHFFYTTPTIAETAVGTYSLYVKYVSAQYIQLLYDYENGYANIDVLNGTVGNYIGISVSVQDVGDGWFRVGLTKNTYAGWGYKLGIGIVTSLTAARRESYTGTASSLLIWGAQLETGSAATTYIPTTTAMATRAADQLSFSVPSGIGRLVFTFDDNSTQTVAVSSGAYTVPTTLNRSRLIQITGTA